MTKEKLISLESYRTRIRAALHAPVPKKHTARPKEYFGFLARELHQVDLTLENHRLATKEEKVGK